MRAVRSGKGPDRKRGAAGFFGRTGYGAAHHVLK